MPDTERTTVPRLNAGWDRRTGVAFAWSDDRLAEAVAQIARAGWMPGRSRANGSARERSEVLAEVAARVSRRGLLRGLGYGPGDPTPDTELTDPPPASLRSTINDYRGDHR